MKHTFLKSFLIAGSVLMFVTGCKKLEDFKDTDVRPDAATIPVTHMLLSNAQVGLGGIEGAVNSGVRAGLFVQYFSETQYTDASLYSEPKFDFGSYAGSLMDLRVIINRNSDPATKVIHQVSGSNENQIAIAKILTCYGIWLLTDRWGDIPFSEALRGLDNFNPAYDTQEDVYKKMISDLKEANALFDGGNSDKNFVKGDTYYGSGSPLEQQASWKKLSNTLRMMMAMRLSKVYPGSGEYAAIEFADAVNDAAGFITDNAENLVINYPGAAFQHPWFVIYNGRSDYAYSKTLSDLLNNMTDNRRSAYGGSGSAFPYGLTRDIATNLPTTYAKVLAADYQAQDASMVMVSAAISLLTVAEGIERGWVASAPGYATAKDAYDAAITQSFAQWGLSGASTVINGAGNYDSGTGGGNNLGSNSNSSVIGQHAVTTTKLDRIFLQRYIANYPNGINGWADWRRSCAIGTPAQRTDPAGMPALAPTTFATNSNFGIPRRFVYGPTEQSANPTGLAAAVARLTLGDKPYERVWWDK